jgi:2-polyprenyl-6-methoxyphenol hydroxylase-like FAD-dependent oxidoreductase
MPRSIGCSELALSSRRPQRVAIVGAGIAGLSAAIVVTRAGHDVQVFERRNDPQLGSGAMLLWPDALVVLDALGVGEHVAARARTIDRVEIGGTHGQLLASWSIVGPLRVVERRVLLEVLLAVLPPGALRLGRTVASCAPDRGGVELRGADDMPLDRAELLIGCDGPRSRIREQLFGRSDEPRVGQLAWRAIVLHRDTLAVPHGVVLGTLGEGQSFCAVRLDAERVWWCATQSGDVGPLALSGLARAFAGWPRSAAELILRAGGQPIARPAIGESPAPMFWQQGRVVLLGDAARGCSSELSGASGHALEAAVMLGALLAAHPGEQALREYARARHTRAAAMMRTTRAVDRWPLRQSIAATALRELTLARLLPTLGNPPIACAPHLDAARSLRDAGAIVAASVSS